MEKYICTKEVYAQPMKMGDAYKLGLLQAGKVPSSSEMDNDGYMVKYNNGYFSWSSKDVFEESYMKAESYIDRMLIEKKELDYKVENLEVFMASHKFNHQIDDIQKIMLSAQWAMMKSYSEVLGVRIKLNTIDEESDTEILFGFNIAMVALIFGYPITRKSWDGDKIVCAQIPNSIENEAIENIKSLPDKVKGIVSKTGCINYENQLIIYDRETGKATSWVPSPDDIFSSDWKVVLQ